MKKALITIILVTNVFVTSCLAQKQIDLTYIANAGFFVECNGKQVLIDALFKEGWGSYLTPTNEVISKIIGKQAPFTNSNLLLITHDHGDHFDAAMVEDYLKNNTKNMLVAPSQVINALLKNPDNQKLRSQMVELNKSNSAIFDLTIQGIRIRSFFIQHDTRPIIENFGYLIDIDGIKIFHSGDNTGADSIEYEKLALQNDKIDLAILGFYGFWSTEEERAFTKKYINPKNITLMHIPPAEVRMVKDSVNTIKNFIDITVFENSLDKKSLIFK